MCFFFSSRRRHTRSLRDWSSDVCSSDLPQFEDGHINQFMRPDTQMVTMFKANEAGSFKYFCMVRGHIWLGMIGELDVVNRSEERRVGKECRSGWSAEH